MAVVNNLIVI